MPLFFSFCDFFDIFFLILFLISYASIFPFLQLYSTRIIPNYVSNQLTSLMLSNLVLFRNESFIELAFCMRLLLNLVASLSSFALISLSS